MKRAQELAISSTRRLSETVSNQGIPGSPAEQAASTSTKSSKEDSERPISLNQSVIVPSIGDNFTTAALCHLLDLNVLP